jgi:hypothetical protein
MIDFNTINSLNTELSNEIKDPSFLEFLEKMGYIDVIDNYYESISIILIEYKKHKEEENG